MFTKLGAVTLIQMLGGVNQQIRATWISTLSGYDVQSCNIQDRDTMFWAGCKV